MRKKINLQKILTPLKAMSSSGMLLISILLMGVIYAQLTPSFATVSNLLGVLQQSTGLFFIACGQTLMLLLGGIDLAQGKAVGLISVVCALAILRFGIVGGILVGIALGMLYGLVTGLVVTKLNVQPYIASIGMMFVLEGATYLIARLPVMGLPTGFSIIGRGKLWGVVPVNLIIYAVGFALLIYFLSYTRTGRSFYAIGGNQEIARLSGIKIDKVKLIAWTMNGALVAIGSIILTSRVSSGQPTLGGSLQNEALGAVVIGGTLLDGGRGGVFQTFLGVIFISFLVNGFNLLGISAFLKQALIGLLIIAVVWFSFIRDKRSAKL